MFSNALIRDKDFYEADILDYLRDTYPRQKTIIDAGANIGNHSVYFANFMEYERIFCFEPYYPNFRLLVENMAGYNNVTMMQVALGESNAPVPFMPNFGNMGAGEILKAPTQNVDEQMVYQVLFDELEIEDISLVKLDVEYYEPMVLAGMLISMYKYKPTILIEDSQQSYGPMMNMYNYHLLQSWEHHKTYLYEHD